MGVNAHSITRPARQSAFSFQCCSPWLLAGAWYSCRCVKWVGDQVASLLQGLMHFLGTRLVEMASLGSLSRVTAREKAPSLSLSLGQRLGLQKLASEVFIPRYAKMVVEERVRIRPLSWDNLSGQDTRVFQSERYGKPAAVDEPLPVPEGRNPISWKQRRGFYKLPLRKVNARRTLLEV